MSALKVVHFVGIGGIGMSALARILLQRGVRVSGSTDRRTALTDRLGEEGATIAVGHAAVHVPSDATVVVSSAIAADNVEVRTARERTLPILRRGDLLAQLMNGQRGIAIAGTHGKTTTTAMVACALEGAGIDPTVVIGGERTDTGTNARHGQGAWFVTESDESDGSFLALRPEIAVVTNIEDDHVASDAEFAHLINTFTMFLDEVRPDGLALVGIDEPRGAALAQAKRRARTMTYGFDVTADVRACEVAYRDFGSTFTAVADSEWLGTVTLRVPGAINVLDALPAIAIGRELQIPFATVAQALARFGGVRRRFDVLARSPRMTVVDDYAHHPTAVAATIAAARQDFAGPIVVVFQPHRYSRTRYLADRFVQALSAATLVVLTDVYGASEPPLDGVDATLIGRPLAALGTTVAYVPQVSGLPAYLLESAPPGALVLMLGAGSITDAAAQLAAELASPPRSAFVL